MASAGEETNSNFSSRICEDHHVQQYYRAAARERMARNASCPNDGVGKYNATCRKQVGYMRLRAIYAAKVNPVKLFSVEDLSDIVVLAGPNGVGKTRLVETMLASFRNPNAYRGGAAQPNLRFVVEATSPAERKEWGKDLLDTADPSDAQKLVQTLQKGRRRSNWQSSVLNFESDRTILQIQPYPFTWDYKNPFEEGVGWDVSFSGLKTRFQDTLHTIFRTVRSRRESLALRLEELIRNRAQIQHERASEVLDRLDREFPDPIDAFKRAFSQLLAPKVLIDPDPKSQQLFYSFEGQSFPVSSLSSGEREVVNIVFDFLLRSPSDCIVFFDEPELHLHPELSYKLIQTLKGIGHRNQFVLCTHSPDIITASLDNSVVFVAPFKAEGVNQAISVREDDETNTALKRLGQSIGIIALGKKLVLVEGAVASLDKQTYGAILRERFPNLVLVPSGGRGVVTSFELLHEQVLDKTIWGVEFFMICDRDAVPPSRDFTQTGSTRLKVLNRYHLENYFLDEEVLAGVFESMEPEDSWLRSPGEIRKVFKEIARTQIAYAAALTTSSYFRGQVGNLNIMAKDCHGISIDDLVRRLVTRVGEEQTRIASAVQPAAVESYARTMAKKLQDSLDQDTDDWKTLIPGKPLLNMFASRAKLDSARLKTAFIREAEKRPTNPFQEVIEIFSAFAAG
jgi:predicted ATPase